jgi:hypothetical protein
LKTQRVLDPFRFLLISVAGNVPLRLRLGTELLPRRVLWGTPPI